MSERFHTTKGRGRADRADAIFNRLRETAQSKRHRTLRALLPRYSTVVGAGHLEHGGKIRRKPENQQPCANKPPRLDRQAPRNSSCRACRRSPRRTWRSPLRRSRSRRTSAGPSRSPCLQYSGARAGLWTEYLRYDWRLKGCWLVACKCRSLVKVKPQLSSDKAQPLPGLKLHSHPEATALYAKSGHLQAAEGFGMYRPLKSSSLTPVVNSEFAARQSCISTPDAGLPRRINSPNRGVP
jgi:hypothetical protein